ncbi:MAG TPA: hypothetical protein VK272_03460 [Solirubrobacteraceae bacterium]|nr:hypothetical protein [Solirubrobacteraceae bacterium]
MAVALFWRATWWSGLLIATASAILWMSGWLHRKSANDSLVEALRMGDVHAPSLDRVDRAVEALKVRVVSFDARG